MDEENSKNNKKQIDSRQNFELPEWITILKKAFDEQKKIGK